MLVVITGASKGIGFELVKLFAAQAGTKVIAVSRNIKPLQKLKLANVHPLAANINTNGAAESIIKLVKSKKARIRILINNAGELVNKPFAKTKLPELLSVYGTNVFAPFLLIQSLLPYFESKGAHVVNIGSMGGVQGSQKFEGLSAYSSSKAAIATLSECLALELKPKNIAVNCLALGAVQTEMLGKAFPGYTAPLKPEKMASFIFDFAKNGHRFFNGKILPVSLSTP